MTRLESLEKVAEAARKYINLAPTDGWHFLDCEAAEDNDEDEMLCSCGVGAAENDLNEALSALDAYDTKHSDKIKMKPHEKIRDV